MGLFSSTKIYVDSVIYNMAGDINERTSYLKSLVSTNMLGSDGRRSTSEAIQQGYINGPGIKIRNFALWAKDNYETVGVGHADIYGQATITPEDLNSAIPHGSNQRINVQKSSVYAADFSYWSEQWMLENHPDLFDTDWTSDFDESNGTIIVQFADQSTVAFMPQGYDPTALYAYVFYNIITGEQVGPVVTGPTSTGAYPSVDGWTNVSSVTSPMSVPLNRIKKTTNSYSDGRPNEVSTSTTALAPGTYTYYRAVYTKTEHLGSTTSDPDTGPDQIKSVKKTLYLFRDHHTTSTVQTTSYDEDAGGGVTRTVIIERTTQNMVVDQTYRTDTQSVTDATFSRGKILIYKVNSGGIPSIDAKVNSEGQDGFYFPFIPVRLDNKMIDENYLPEVYAENQKAYRKLTGTKRYIEDVLDPIKTNKDVKDIDYAYIMLGVSLNTKERAAKKYLYRFFDNLRINQQIDQRDYNQWADVQNATDETTEEWVNWRMAQNDPSDPLFGTPMPAQVGARARPTNEIQIKGSGTLNTNVDMRISWQSITRSTGTGLLKPTAKKGDVFVEFGLTDVFDSPIYTVGQALSTAPINVDRIAISRQIDGDHWECLAIIGLVHRNYIYKGKYVEITAKAALADTEESGFLVPLHYETFKSMSLVDSTQISKACSYIVINCYRVVKRGFFKSTFFRIWLVIAQIAIVVAVTIVAGPLAGSIAAALTTMAVHAAGGFTLNDLVTAVLVKVLAFALEPIFGDRIAKMLATLIVVVGMEVARAVASGGTSLADTLTRMASQPSTWINLANAVGNGVSQYIQDTAMIKIGQTTQLQKDYEKKSAEIGNRYREAFGSDMGQIDTFELNNWAELNSYEDPASFLERTLIVGSDLAELNKRLINEFTELSLTLPTNVPR